MFLPTVAMVCFVPCIPFGMNIENAGIASCLMGAIYAFIPLVNIFCWIKVRGAIREKNGIDVSLTQNV